MNRNEELRTENGELRTIGNSHPKRTFLLFIVLSSPFLVLSFRSAVAVESLVPRLFFSDAKISVAFPDGWNLEPAFPVGPLFSRTTQEGTPAWISCRISDPVDSTHIASDIPEETLRQFAQTDLTPQLSQGRLLSKTDGTIAGHNAYEVTWEDKDKDGNKLQHQNVYFFIDNRVYLIALDARADSFPWLVPDFQQWLGSIRVLSSRDSGALDSPAHGGLWIHQTGGVKIVIPENWLIGVADDRQLGATLANDKMHSEMTATVDVETNAPAQISEDDRQEARKVIDKKGFRILSESEEPFHGLPAFQVMYEGTDGGRYLRGEDIWVASPKGRWLFNIEGDGAFFNKLADDYSDILNSIQFL